LIANIVFAVTVIIFVAGLIPILTNRITGRLFGIWVILVLIGSAIYLSLSCDHILWVGKIPMCIESKP